MRLQRTLSWVSVCLASLLLLSGCGGSTPKVGSAERKAFASASAEVKQNWESALALDSQDKWLEASAAYHALLKAQINIDQFQAVQTAVAALNLRMQQAADTGNTAAQEAVKALRNQPRN